MLCVFNGERWLNEALESIEWQSFCNFEIVVVNDGSTDRTSDILAEAAHRDSRYRIFSQTNRGLVSSLNFGISQAKGDLIARMDADDLMMPRRLERQVRFMRSHPNVAAAGSAIYLIDEAGERLYVHRYPCGVEIVREELSLRSSLAHPSVMMRRSAVMAVGAYREALRHCEDYDLWLRLSEAYDVDNLPDVLISYRVHAGSVSHRHSQQMALAAFVSKHCAKERRAGRPDPLLDQERAIDLGILDVLKIGPEDRAQFLFESIKAALQPGRKDVDQDSISTLMETAWDVKGNLPADRFARNCAVPFSFLCLKHRDRKKARQWLMRAFQLSFFNASWALLRELKKGIFLDRPR